MLLQFLAIIIVTTAHATNVYAKETACIARAEMGETTSGQHLYERDKDLQIRNLARFDFEKLTVISAEGKRGALTRVEANVYKSTGAGPAYYFVTNDERSIVTEIAVGAAATYLKVLLCKSQ